MSDNPRQSDDPLSNEPLSAPPLATNAESQIPNIQPITNTGILLRKELESFDTKLALAYWANEPIEQLMLARSNFMDALLTNIWHSLLSESDLALYAVGGYGRTELLPQSDLDLLIVGPNPVREQGLIEQFLHQVFDLHLEVGHSVRSLNSIKAAARSDLTIATSLFEQRPIVTTDKIHSKLTAHLGSRRLWPSKDFFRAKLAEQEKRHNQFDNVEYGLEPNVKESPGGLRDVHVAMWVCSRHFKTTSLDALEELGVLTTQERGWLYEGRRFLNWVRFGLHLVVKRKDDRLQFEYQRELAQRLGYVDTESKRAVERFMQDYYRHVLLLREVNDIFLQYFDEHILRKRERVKREVINERFRLRNGYLAVTSPEVFAKQPSALLEMFVLMANRRDIAGVRADTIRLIREHVDLIDDEFRADPTNTRAFIDLLKAPYTLVSQLTRMRRYGILSRYLPEYGKIVGQMQHDLFHVYTVDAHTMQVIRNLRRLHYRSAEKNYPVAHHCVKHIPKIELLYIAGLYHDIGKGRGGDHSTLGAVDAAEFCQRHGINQADTDLVVWLVEKHLVMSDIAQRQDIHDPDVIHEFASDVKSRMRLNYLYALTVADINATNPTLWNNWRATLLRQLYSETRRALRRGLESPMDRETTIDACRDSAEERLHKRGVNAADIERVWENLEPDFYLQHSPRDVAHLTERFAAHDLSRGPLVLVQDASRQFHGEGTTNIYVYMKDQPNLFAACVVTFDKLRMPVFEAHIHTGTGTVACNRFVVLEESGDQVDSSKTRRDQIQEALTAALVSADQNLAQQMPTRRLSRPQRQLLRPSEVSISTEPGAKHSCLTINASDRPGLLARIGLFFSQHQLNLISARIATLGDRVEDAFNLQSAQGEPLIDEQQNYELANALRQYLDHADSDSVN